MHAPTTRTFAPARIAALVLLALLVVALGYLRFGRGAEPVSVPAGAHAGQLILKPCHYDTERGSYPADCGTLIVPENRRDPASRLIALPVTRIHARSPHPKEPIFRLEGGPGRSNMHFAGASRFAGARDVVLVGYRGVDGSSVLDCPEVVSVLRHSPDLVGPATFRAAEDAYKECASRLRAGGTDLAGYTLPQRVDDLEAARRALGYGRIDLLSESAGTRTAMIYSWRYPTSLHRSVMIGANPPGNFLWNAKTIDGQIRHYSALCAGNEACRARTRNLAASLKATNARIPDRWWFLPIKKGNVRLASFFGLMSATSAAAPISSPMTIDAWLSAAKGDASGLWLESLLADLTFPDVEVWGDVAAVARADAGAADRHFAAGKPRGSILGDPGTDFLWAGGRLRDAWPSTPDDNAYSRVRTSNTETLLISGTLDLATPAQNATRQLLPHLPRGHQVLLPALGHTDDFWSYQPKASSRLVNAFLASGRVDDSLYTRRAMDFGTGASQTLIAKIILASMLGFAALAVLSLLWMPRQISRRGAFGRKTSALLRSLYPLVLGLGGWFLGALVVMTTMPTVPLDDELLAGLSIGPAIGLGIYWAWVHPSFPAATRAIGFCASLGGGLLGAWLGFNSTTGPLAIVTTIVGAGIGANLALIFLDVSRERSARDRSAEATAAPAFADARPELQT